MRGNKEKMLTVDFDIFRGLILKWNLNSGDANSFFRHVLIFDVKRGFDFKGFSNKYFQKIKQGDMITFACINQQEQYFILKWREKSPITELQTSRLHPSLTSVQNLIKMFQFLDPRTEQFTEPIIFNIVTEKTGQELKKLHSFLKTFKQKKQAFLINVFCQTSTSIQPNSGINWWNIRDLGQECEQNWNFLKLYLNQISFIKIKITIECENGVFSSKKEDQWCTIDFNKISRSIYAPTFNYVQDVIQFINEDSTSQINYILNINLQFTELDNHVYSANKKISISTMSEKVYQRTFAGREVQYATQMYPGFYSIKNPFRSQSLVWFKKGLSNGNI